jgi:hypothetical protein
MINADRYLAYIETDGEFELQMTADLTNDDVADIILNIFDAYPQLRTGIINAASTLLQAPASRPTESRTPNKA